MNLIRRNFIFSTTLVGLGIGLSGFIFSASKPTVKAHAQAPEAYSETLPGTVVKIQMVPIPGGTVTIGGKPVTVKPFFIATVPTPWEAYDAFTASGPASRPYDQTDYTADAIARPSHSYILPDLGWGHHGYPAINLSFINSVMFCRWLASTTKKKYRLPTEAEWEFAARDGSTAPWKMSKDQLEKSSWNATNSTGTTHPVGSKAATKLGLFDMFGNVGQWATDVDGKPVLCGGTFRDDLAEISPTTRKRWAPKWQETDPQLPKSRWWLSDAPFAGFRVVCEP